MITALACTALYILFVAFVSVVMGPRWRRLNEMPAPTARQRRQWRRERLRFNPRLR